jgi:GH24 family phage-related lysozyme (muramidase)
MKINDDRLRGQLIIDEGYRNKVYADSLGNLTVGIGHLVTKADNLKLGDVITNAQVDNLFNHDLRHAIEGAAGLVREFYELPPLIQEVLVNMCFNLGARGLSKFKRFLAAINRRDYGDAAEEMRGTKWRRQVGVRADRLIAIVQDGGMEMDFSIEGDNLGINSIDFSSNERIGIGDIIPPVEIHVCECDKLGINTSVPCGVVCIQKGGKHEIKAV